MSESDLSLEIGAKIELDINDLSSEGCGVGRIEGIAVFVDGALPGELVEAEITALKKKYLTAKMIKLVTPSAVRRKPFCPVFEECGGCSLQHLSYESQLEYKKKKVKDAVERISGLKDIEIGNVIAADADKGYRNKVQFFLDYRNGEVSCGFFGRKSHIVVNNQTCFLINDEANMLKNEFASIVRDNISEFYDSKSSTLILKSIIIRQAMKTGELMLVIISSIQIDAKLTSLFSKLAGTLTNKIPNLKSVYCSASAGLDNFKINTKIRHLKGSRSITEIIGDLRFAISPGSFFQVNSSQAENLYTKIVELADLMTNANETVLDLFCGTGTIGLFLASKGAKVFGIDISRSAIEDAAKNAKINNISSTRFIEGDVFKLKEAGISKKIPLSGANIDKIDIVVVDPPRDGLGEKLVNLISEFNAKKVIYASCNPATLARDLKIFDILGYKTNIVEPIDMFPHTEHIECIILMTKCGQKDK